VCDKWRGNARLGVGIRGRWKKNVENVDVMQGNYGEENFEEVELSLLES
jgi:hypothetical protein